MKLKHKLNVLLNGVDPKWLRSSRWVCTFPVPVECVIRKPGEQVFPREGRIYPTEFYENARGELVDYQELLDGYDCHTFGDGTGRPMFPGTSAFKEVFAVEVWHDCGDDGHTEYQMFGWVLTLGHPADPLNIEYSRVAAKD